MLLFAPVVKWISRQSSELLFQVRILAGAQRNHFSVRAGVIETPLPPWQGGVLPLNHTRDWCVYLHIQSRSSTPFSCIDQETSNLQMLCGLSDDRTSRLNSQDAPHIPCEIQRELHGNSHSARALQELLLDNRMHNEIFSFLLFANMWKTKWICG